MNATSATGHNELWRYKNGTNMATHMYLQTHTTRPAGHNGYHKNSPNSSDNRNGLTCFRCGEQCHMRLECSKDRVFCTHCRTPNHDTKACRKHHNSTPSPTNSHTLMGYHPTATPPPLLGTASTETHPHKQVQPQLDSYSRTISTPNNPEPVPPSRHHIMVHYQPHQLT